MGSRKRSPDGQAWVPLIFYNYREAEIEIRLEKKKDIHGASKKEGDQEAQMSGLGTGKQDLEVASPHKMEVHLEIVFIYKFG